MILNLNKMRTLLILLDRDIDLPIMLNHACSFDAMIKMIVLV